MTDTAPARVYRGDRQSVEKLESQRRLLVLTAILTMRGGAEVEALAKGLGIMNRVAVLGSLKSLEAKGLVTSRLEPSATREGLTVRRYYTDPELDLQFDI
jgi:predicted ArsR family transcriptional regulator